MKKLTCILLAITLIGCIILTFGGCGGSSKIVGTWVGEDGTIWEFSSIKTSYKEFGKDLKEMTISTSDGSEEYDCYYAIDDGQLVLYFKGYYKHPGSVSGKPYEYYKTFNISLIGEEMTITESGVGSEKHTLTKKY